MVICYIFIILASKSIFMSQLHRILVDNVKRIRKEKRISQRELEERTGIVQASLSRLENGKLDPSVSAVEKLASGLEVSPMELLTNPDAELVTLDDKLKKIELLSEYDQKLVDALLESLLEKARLVQVQDLKMKVRLEELERVRKEL